MEINEWLAVIFITLFVCFLFLSIISFRMVSIMRKLNEIKNKL